MELDVIALCCDWAEYPNAAEACAEYAASGVPVGVEEEDAEKQCLEWLQEQTQVIEFSGGILVMAF